MAEELSLREQLMAVRDEIVAREPDEPVEESKAEAIPDAPEPETKPRDEHGRFAPVEAKAEEAPPEVIEKAPKEPKEAPPAVDPPASWTAAERGLWGKLPPEAQRTIARREADVHKALTRQDEERALAKEFTRIATPYEPVLRAANTTPLKAFETFMNVAYVLRTGSPEQKAQMIAQAAQQNGVDLRAFLQSQPQASQFAQLPPDVLRELQETRAWREQQRVEQEQSQAAAFQSTLSEIETFRADPAHPHFDAVRDAMVSLLQTGTAKTLQEAYDSASWAVPAIRSQLLQAQQSEKAKAEKVQRAKLKGVSVRGGPGGVVPSNPDRSLRQELEANFAEAAGRV